MKKISLSALCAASLISIPATAQIAPEASTSAPFADVYARYEAPAQIQTEKLADGRYKVRAPLSLLRSAQGSIHLSGANARETLYVNIAPQARIDDARLLLRHASSSAMDGMSPHLRVSINQQFIAQVKASTSQTSVLDEIVLDKQALSSGFNAIELNAIQRHTIECQDPTSPELWTDIDTLRSTIEFTYTRRPFAGTLADLDAAISPGLAGIEKISIVTAENINKSHLKWGALISQAIANRLDYKIPDISHSTATRIESETAIGPAPYLSTNTQDSDLILVGTFEEIGQYLSIDPASVSQEEGYLAIGPSPADPSRFVIIASGHNAKSVGLAIDALGLSSFPFADTNEARILEEDAVSNVNFAASAPLQSGKSYTFKDLGLNTTSITGSQYAQAALNFEMPANYFATEQDIVELELDYAYGAAQDPDSVLNIFVNDVFRKAITLSNPDGEATAGYKILLPSRVLQPGPNKVSFKAELNKSQIGKCAPRNLRNLAFILEGSSLIRLPDAQTYVELPNLGLMKNTGYPYSGVETEKFSILAADATSPNLAAVWTLTAKLGQIHKAWFSNVDMDFGLVPPANNTLLVGAKSTLDPILKSPFILTPSNNGRHKSLYELANLGRNGAVISGENPSANETLLTVVMGQNASTLENAVKNLVEPSHWSQLDGGAAVWREKPSTFATQSAQDTYFVGNLEAAERIAFHNAKTPLKWLLIMGGLLFGVASILAFVARYMRKRNQP
ncbi:cellulose biosynthesis cyclic di-GMP-binding regulatory protein BcsB [Hirschia litorea]|uniref:Cyclic di-GMP-binding protein n=1 Tax=Hirschia litorea TaxID=1199156 RepID=A0ABW2IN13_9PROT